MKQSSWPAIASCLGMIIHLGGSAWALNLCVAPPSCFILNIIRFWRVRVLQYRCGLLWTAAIIAIISEQHFYKGAQPIKCWESMRRQVQNPKFFEYRNGIIVSLLLEPPSLRVADLVRRLEFLYGKGNIRKPTALEHLQRLYKNCIIDILENISIFFLGMGQLPGLLI